MGSIPIPGTENKRLTACPTSPQNPKNGPVVLVLYLLQKKTPIGNLIKADQGMNCLFYTRIQALLQNCRINLSPAEVRDQKTTENLDSGFRWYTTAVRFNNID